MATTHKITQFNGYYKFLSNFFIEPDGTHTEGEYQAAKCANEADQAQFQGINPYQAKALGYKVKLRSDWDQVKISIMKDVVRKKFLDHSLLMKKLLDTGDAQLIEENNHRDTFWGTVNGKGTNHLGKILMELREEFRNAKSTTENS